MSEVVLDASALMVFLQEEPGAPVVEAHLDRAAIGTINLAEVLGKLVDKGMGEPLAWSVVADLGLEIVDLDTAQCRTIAALRPATKGAGLSLGDRACLALAKERRLPALTADRAWAALTLGVEIRLVR